MLVETELLSQNNKIPARLVAQVPDSAQTLVLIFGPASCYDNPECIASLTAAYPTATILGCSTAGEILGTDICDNSIAAAAVQFEHSTLRLATAPVPDVSASHAAGQAIAKALAGPDLRAVLVLSDGLQVNGSALVNGLNSALPESVVVTGGLAGDGDRFQRTWVVKDRRPVSGYVTAVGLYGPRIRVGHGSKGGWDNFGPERTITRAEANVLYELDGAPALQLYKSYLGDRAAGLPATGLLFPLAIRESRSHTKQLVRTILAVDEATQSMTFAGNVPQGHLAQLMRANFNRLIDGASEAALATHSVATGPTLAIAISCVGRRLILGARAEEEIEATKTVLPAQCKQIGFYSYGEISPYATGACDLHNQTMTLTTIAEA